MNKNTLNSQVIYFYNFLILIRHTQFEAEERKPKLGSPERASSPGTQQGRESIKYLI